MTSIPCTLLSPNYHNFEISLDSLCLIVSILSPTRHTSTTSYDAYIKEDTHMNKFETAGKRRKKGGHKK